jgi:hypothetical protein
MRIVRGLRDGVEAVAAPTQRRLRSKSDQYSKIKYYDIHHYIYECRLFGAQACVCAG